MGLSRRHRIILAILILGAFAQIAQAVLIREGLVVFYGNEVSLGAFYGSWLLWIAIGSLLVFSRPAAPLAAAAQGWLRWLLLALPPVLLLQVLLLRLVRLVLDVSASEFVPLGQLFLSLFLVTIPGSLVLGLAFPLACRALDDATAPNRTVRNVAWLYGADALGALLGGVLFTFVLLRWFGLAGTLGVVMLLLAVAAGLLRGQGAGSRWPHWLPGIIGVLILLPPVGQQLGWQLDRLRFRILHPQMQLLDSLDTRYGHVELARLGNQTSVLQDGRISESFPLPREVQQQAAYLMAQADGARRLLVFGGFAGGLVTELLRYPVQRIDLVQQDRAAFRRILPYLPEADRQALRDPRLRVHFLDGRRFVNEQSPERPYDLVLVLDATPASAYSNRFFTLEFYRRVQQRMAPGGVLCTRVSSASHYLGRTVGGFTGSVYHTLKRVFPEIAILPGDRHLYCAAALPERVSESPEVLKQRYLAIPLDPRPFAADSFHTLLQADEIGYARERLEEVPAELNSDERPVTYYLNMILWGRLTASGLTDALERLRRLGPWPYLLPLLLGVLLWLLRSALEGFERPRLQRQSASLALALLGLIAMAVQLVVLFSYQAHVGFMFQRVALLNGLFMTGLALGAWAGQGVARRGRPVPALAGVLSLVVLALAALPALLVLLGGARGDWQEGGYLLLSALLGLLTGSGFPLAVAAAERERHGVVRSSGIAQAADNLGGAVGGVLTGTLLVPLLGMRWSCWLLAGYGVLALLPLAFARWMPERIGWLARRGHRAFPWSGLGWALLWAVLLVWGWRLFTPDGTARRVHFDDQRLAAVSGSATFEARERPFPHYLGSGGEAGKATVSLSTLAAAPGVRGYAGPLNLLIALDDNGVLRGVRYLDSDETPAYIAGIQQWLERLVGRDLSQRPLARQGIDALSGATVSSRAALAAIDASARAAGRVAFGRDWAPEGGGRERGSPWTEARLLATLALLLLFFPAYLSGSERARLGLQAATLVLLGLWLNSLLTEVDLVNLSLGRWPSPRDNPQRWLLLGFALAGGVLFGQVWCGNLCPFGALQELVSRLGNRLGLRRYPERRLETAMRFLKYLLLAAMLILVWTTGDGRWARFDPMQFLFSGRWPAWAGILAGVVLLASLFHYRFWCRYFCPLGAFLALFNKLALLQRLAPKRRFEHCDLGVRDEYDIDCIRCNRCLTGIDTRRRRRRENRRRKTGLN